MNLIQAIILAVVEGLTEYLPISSTGHMIITSFLLGIPQNEYVKMYTVAIQFGAILSVLALYWRMFLRDFSFYIKLLIAFIPSAIIGFLLADYIDELFETPIGVSLALIGGGIILLFVNDWFKSNEKKPSSIDDVTYPKALMIGFFQVIALFPGVSRSAATIIGGLTQKLNRRAAAEFSFFLAVPTMLAATVYKTYKYQKLVGFTPSDIKILVLGNIIAFVVALLAIKGFLGVLNRFGFKLFGWYRIGIGLVILMLYFISKYAVQG